MLLLVKDRSYKWLIFVCLVVVVTALFLARGHYSIDILSGLFFSYAIREFGEKHLSMFDLGKEKESAMVRSAEVTPVKKSFKKEKELI
jgi:hypothetical protein